MKKISKILLFIFMFLAFPFISEAKVENPKIFLFHLSGCPHCAQAREYIRETLMKEYPDIELVQYEVSRDQVKNNDLLNKIQAYNGKYSSSVPYILVGDSVVISWNSDSKNVLSNAFKTYINNGVELNIPELVSNGSINNIDTYNNYINDYQKKVEDYKKNNVSLEQEEQKEEVNENIKELPLIGKVDVTKVSLPILAAIIGFIDGFNPCAMWILLFLISMLIGTKDQKRMWILGLSFLFASAFVYFLFMIAWLNIALQMNQILWIRTLIGIVALVVAFINLKSFFFPKKESGCEVVDNSKRKKIFDKIKKFTKEKSLFIALIGVVTLAFSVNLVELACSAGLPLLFTQILALNNLSKLMYLFNILVYIFFFLLDDVIVFVIAMVTLKVTGITTKYAKFSHLIGGILMLIIGILLIFKPEILMLGL